MSPVVQGIKDPDGAAWEWLHLEDFSPGIYDASNISTSKPIVEAPLGAANSAGTWCCMALPGGGLGPLPRMTGVTLFATTPPAGNTFIVGALIVPDAGGAQFQLLVMLESDSGLGGTTHHYRVYAINPTTTVVTQVLAVTGPHMAGIFGSPYPQVTRAGTDTFTKAGTPIAVWPSNVSATATDASGHVYVYPTPTARTAYGVKDLITPDTQITGQVVCFDNRILVLSGIPYVWPGGAISTNENIAFTTPPNSLTLGNQQTVLVAENPFGYGAWGSVSTGELLFVKKLGGGVVVNGDIESPNSVLYLPGVHPVGDFYGRAAPGQAGLYYGSEHQGVWLWDGGNVSQKVSPQLRDDFYDVQTISQIPSNNYGFYVERWGQWMVFSGNWAYNEAQGGWWTLYPTATTDGTAPAKHTLFWWLPGPFGYEFYALPLAFTATHFLYRFDSRLAAEKYQWTSVPIHVAPTANHRVDVREVVVRASCPTAGSTVTVKVGTQYATSSTTAIGVDPSILRFHFGIGATALKDIELTLIGAMTMTTTTNQAPLIHSVDIAFALRAHEQAEN